MKSIPKLYTLLLIESIVFIFLCIYYIYEEINIEKTRVDRFKVIQETKYGFQDYNTILVYDSLTHVEYYIFECGSRSMITPLYNSDGSLKIHEYYH